MRYRRGTTLRQRVRRGKCNGDGVKARRVEVDIEPVEMISCPNFRVSKFNYCQKESCVGENNLEDWATVERGVWRCFGICFSLRDRTLREMRFWIWRRSSWTIDDEQWRLESTRISTEIAEEGECDATPDLEPIIICP